MNWIKEFRCFKKLSTRWHQRLQHGSIRWARRHESLFFQVFDQRKGLPNEKLSKFQRNKYLNKISILKASWSSIERLQFSASNSHSIFNLISVLEFRSQIQNVKDYFASWFWNANKEKNLNFFKFFKIKKLPSSSRGTKCLD